MQNLAQVLTRLGIQYRDNGESFIFRCVNPEHEDRNPSMNMLKDSGFFKCWSCGVSGSFKKFLTYFPGFVYDTETLGWITQGRSNNWSQKKFAEFGRPKEYFIQIEGKLEPVWDSPLAIQYLRRRDCHKEFIEDFQIQYALNILVNRTPDKDGVKGYKGTSFTNRLVIPIYEEGKMVNLEGRTLIGAEPKVLYPKFSKSNCMFNWDRLDFNEMVYLTEGIMDLPNLYKISKNVTSTFGSALTYNQKEKIKKIPHLCVIPDQDEAGFGMLRAIEQIRDKEYYIATIPNGKKDAGECNKDELEHAIKERRRAVKFFMDEAEFLQEEIRWGKHRGA